MPKKLSLPSNEILLYILSAATAVTVAWALIYIDGGQDDLTGRGLVILRGLLLGTVSGFATAIVSHRLQRVKAKEAKRWALGSLAGMLFAELVVVSFATYSTMNPALQVLWWPLRALIAVSAGAFIPAVSIGIASVSGSLQADDYVAPLAQAPVPIVQAPVPIAQAPVPVAKADPPAFSDENLIAQYIVDPFASNAKLAQIFGRSAQAVSARRIVLEQQGRIVKTGKEIKVSSPVAA